jgi:hypothetical protein
VGRRPNITELIIIGVGILLAVVLSPIWVPIVTYVYLKEKITAWRFGRYVKKNDGKTFFCFTHRRTSVPFVRENILPILPPSVEVIYITEKFDKLEANSKFAGEIIFTMAEKKQGFPCLAKFVNGKVLIESINHELYQTIVRSRDPDKLIQRVVKFYSESNPEPRQSGH